jgi:hypothetical protein
MILIQKVCEVVTAHNKAGYNPVTTGYNPKQPTTFFLALSNCKIDYYIAVVGSKRIDKYFYKNRLFEASVNLL